MNLANSMDFFINQGPVFWAATASVGTGGALLITALYVYLRRLVHSDRFTLKRRVPSAGTVPPPAASPEIRITDTGYSLAGKPAMNESVPDAESAPLGELLARLRTAGDRLEGALPRANEVTGKSYSKLKTYLNSVEVESKAGIG